MKNVITKFQVVCLAATMLMTGCDMKRDRESGKQWRLVYQNDLNGKPIYGKIETLVNAMKNGAPIRVSWGGREADGSTWIEFAEPDFTTVMNDTAVVVQFPVSLIQTHYTDPGKSFLATNPPMAWRALMSTTGLYHQFHYDIFNGSIGRIMYSRTNISWYSLSTELEMPPAAELMPEGKFVVDSVKYPAKTKKDGEILEKGKVRE
jgi:hypothetical protein